jgi:hypothetical protein
VGALGVAAALFLYAAAAASFVAEDAPVMNEVKNRI